MLSNAVRWITGLSLALVAASAQALLPIQHWQTGNGARVYFVENHDLPMLDIRVDFRAGAAFDSRQKSGTASMANQMLRLGAEGMDEDEIARKLADVGAEMSGRFDTDRAGLALRTLTSRQERDQALAIFARVLQRPSFPQGVLDREKVRLIAALKEADTKPETIVGRTVARLVYGDHPYGLRASGEVDTVARIARDDLVSFYREHYNPGHAVVAIMGDVTREEAAALAEAVTGQLPRADGPEPQLPPVPELKAGTVRWIAHPATQSHILIAAPGIRRTDPDYFPALVANHVLGGGGFTSRITDEVRQKRGLAYSAYSYFSPQLEEGLFVIGMQTRRDQADEALAVVGKTLSDFVAQGATEKELLAAKQNIIGGFPLRLDSNRKIVEYLSLIGFYRLPLTYLDDFVKNVERVTVADARQVFARRVDPGRMVTAVVGATDERAAAAANAGK